ncbi:L,D-transpeptidase [uncultured Nitratireductor sp.]|uniref:L,D-transpeptidase n=1 Tax=uncultured Nitratireductor sp. TaxID=520953 RepID=UPI0025D77145|nr:L,D-transpeptidase [uncultured Nitratireductor sp.]
MQFCLGIARDRFRNFIRAATVAFCPRRWTVALMGVMTLTVSVALAQPGGYDPRTWSFDATSHTLVQPGQSEDRGSPNTQSNRVRPTREVVPFNESVPVGTIVVSTRQKRLYLVLGDKIALRYTVGVGRDGFSWSGQDRITQKREWPDWRPPDEMRRREAAKGNLLPAHVEGGPNNPLGARALYIGSTLYRIHGTNQPWTVGQATSSGCIRLTNEDAIDLYERVAIGATVIVRN